MAADYSCSKCGISVVVIDGEIIRPCGHDDDGVIASSSAILRGITSINKTQELDDGRIPQHERTGDR